MVVVVVVSYIDGKDEERQLGGVEGERGERIRAGEWGGMIAVSSSAKERGVVFPRLEKQGRGGVAH